MTNETDDVPTADEQAKNNPAPRFPDHERTDAAMDGKGPRGW